MYKLPSKKHNKLTGDQQRNQEVPLVEMSPIPPPRNNPPFRHTALEYIPIDIGSSELSTNVVTL